MKNVNIMDKLEIQDFFFLYLKAYHQNMTASYIVLEIF